MNLTELAHLMDLPKPTVHRLVGGLLATGALEADDSRQRSFSVGRRLWKLLHLAQNEDVVANFAQIICDRLTEEIAETCYVVKLGLESAETIARAVPDQGYRLHVFPGHELPAHAAASVKALLAYQPPQVRDRLLREPLAAYTEFTKTTRQAVDEDLRLVQELGYAVCDREIDAAIMAYACPVHLSGAGVIYSIGVTGPCSRLTRQPASYWTSSLAQGAADFARLLSQGKR